jgi:hypothetical protein
VSCVIWLLCVSNELFAAAISRPSTIAAICRDQADTEPRHILGVFAEMVCLGNARRSNAPTRMPPSVKANIKHAIAKALIGPKITPLRGSKNRRNHST